MVLPIGLFVLALVPASPAPPGAGSEPAPQEAVVPHDWLVLSAVDGRGRRPFRPDAVLAAHVLAGRAPAAGETLSGERGEATWEAVEAGDSGRVNGPAGSIGYAYSRLQVPERTVRLAKLTGASTLILNGRAVAGDLYGYGWGGLPVVLEAGANDVYVSGVRGSFTLAFEPAATVLVPGAFSHTLPDLVVGEAPFAELGLCVRNASDAWLPTASVEIRGARWVGDDGAAGEELSLLRSTFVFEEGLAPLAVRNLAVRIAPREPGVVTSKDGTLALEVAYTAPGVEPVLETLRLAVRGPGARRNRTYRSAVDGSVQLYAVVPPAARGEGAEGGEEQAAAPGLVLTLHGAGVFAPGQAGSYAPKPDLWIVAPTNRSKFGFDWQDWGRRDAYDALAAALAESGVDRRRVYLTGHSMGGHGTWHLGANDPDGFAAIAPSAGWQSFDTYGSRPDGALAELWHRADAPSRTIDLVGNLAQTPIYVLHGDADDNVPVSEARDMVALIEAAGGAPTLHVQPGAGHWWDGPAAPGADCVDWPGIFELFRATEIPRDPAEIDFTTVDPGTDATHHWVRVVQVDEAGRPARVRGSLVDGAVSLATENVRMLELVGPAAATEKVVLDGVPVALAERFVRTDGTWRRDQRSNDRSDAQEKSPERMGPLKRGFDRRFVLVVPTGGDADENAAAFERASFDAGVWWYRGNGDAPLVRDTDLLARPASYRDRNVVLYGNADTNRAWDAALSADAPIRVRRGAVSRRPAGGDRAERFAGAAIDALFVYPRRDDADGLVVALASTGPAADRRASALALFTSGVGYPDYAIVGPLVLEDGDGGVLAAGFFDHAWR